MLKTVKNGSGIRVDPPPRFFKIPTFSRLFFWGASLSTMDSTTMDPTIADPTTTDSMTMSPMSFSSPFGLDHLDFNQSYKLLP